MPKASPRRYEEGCAPDVHPWELTVVDLGHRPYGPTWDLQRQLVQARLAGQVGDTLLLVEHPPTYTVGRHGRPANVLWDENQRAAAGIELFYTDRGGDVTYHGPGQLVGYPIVHLRELGLGVREYIAALESALVETCRRFGLDARTERGLVGVWVKDRKIAAIGVRCSRWVTSHGFAFNVTTDLRHFDGIIPCGLADRGVTSLARELDVAPPWAEVCTVTVEALARALGYRHWRWQPAAELDQWLRGTRSALEQVAHEEG